MKGMVKKQVEEVQAQIQDKNPVYVLFYASWCPFSQRFLPIFEEYEKTNPNVCLKVVIDDKPDVCEEYGIEYYPTVLLFKKGKVDRRLASEPHVGLTKAQLKEFTS